MIAAVDLTEDVSLRPLTMSDANELAAAYRRNRSHLAQWEPSRSEEFFTEARQAEDIATRIASGAAGTGFSLGLFDSTTIIGRFNLGGVVRGPFQSAGLGYWIDARYTGRGLATAAVGAMVRAARDDLGLHRLEASTLTHNRASQRVLVKAGFQQIGTAPRYLQIAGEWQDHDLFQTILHS